MAKIETVELVDDLDGTSITDGGQTVTFSFRGADYELDLSEQNASRLDDALKPFLDAGRRVGGRRQSSASKPGRPDKTQLAAMREWAKQHGYPVSDRGRVSQKVQDAYHAAR